MQDPAAPIERDIARTVAHVVVPYSASNSSVRTRAVHWVDRLIAQGHVPRGSVAFHGPGNTRRRVPLGADVLLVRNARRFTRGRYEQRLMHRARLGVYDLDDGLPWDNGRIPGLGRWWKQPWPRSLVAERTAQACDRMIVGNAVLAEWAERRCSDVRVIPTCVEPADYGRRTSWSIDAPVIGWIGSPATTGYLLDIAEQLRLVHERTGARVELIGAARDADRAIGDFASNSAWVEKQAFGRIMAWDVGVMPLRDGVYERAKCGYKLLQYAAAGVPAIASPVGVNDQLVSAMDAFAPATSDEWVGALCEALGESAERRKQRAMAGFAVADEYSYDHWQERWLDAVGWVGP